VRCSDLQSYGVFVLQCVAVTWGVCVVLCDRSRLGWGGGGGRGGVFGGVTSTWLWRGGGGELGWGGGGGGGGGGGCETHVSD